MTPAEILQTIVVGLFAVSFGLWAKRLDKALDLLEKIQMSMWERAIVHERRLTRLEAREGVRHDRNDE